MKTASIGEIQKNFARILRSIKSNEEIIITKRGKPIAKIIPLNGKKEIIWPDFYNEALELKGKSASTIIIESREERI